MKWLLYIFLLANLATFFWHYQPGLFHADVNPDVNNEADATSVPQLVLLREYQAKPLANQKTIAGPEICYNLGPFSKRQQAQQVRKELKAKDVVASLRVVKDQSRPGYWVLIPASKDRKAARQVIARLKQKKVKDYFLVATGSQKNAVSLGVFSRADLAQKQLEIIKKLGFNVTVSQVDLPKREYWLEWPAAAQSKLGADLLSRWHKRYPGIGSTRVKCHEISASG